MGDRAIPPTVVSQSVDIDLSRCACEAIHISGGIQPHGVLAIVDPDGRVSQVSANTGEHFGVPPEELLGATLDKILTLEDASYITGKLAQLEPGEEPTYLGTITVILNSDRFHAIGHRQDGAAILEFEPDEATKQVSFHDVYALVRKFSNRLKQAADIPSLAECAANEIRTLTGFDRVLVYRFNRDWSGHVIAEAKINEWGSYLDLWFPASDIPEQARKLYQLNRLRLIVDAAYRPVPITPTVNPATGKPLDLTFASLRSVSTVHLEYLRNMGVASSMSISLLSEDSRLWGLIACHHRTPRFLPFEVRTACDLLGRAVSTQVAIHEEREDYERRIRLKSITTQLLQYTAQEKEFLDGLSNHTEELLDFAGAGGAALLYGGRCTPVGRCPPDAYVIRLVEWLVERGREEIYSTDCLPAVMPEFEQHKEIASGVLAISISKIYSSYILWFRPEVTQTVAWGGDPRMPLAPAGDSALNDSGRLHTRKSFESWKEIVDGRSLPWHETEVEAAADLRNALIGIVLRKAEEMAQISEELQRSNRELEAFSYSVSHDLRAPFRHIVGYAELLKQSSLAKLDERDLRYLDIITQSAQFAGTLVDNLLSFSQVGRARLKLQPVATEKLVRDVILSLRSEVGDRQIVWKIATLPQVHADLTMFRLVWQNLLQNAIKYTRERGEAVISVAAESNKDETIFQVRDNGVGFEQQYAGKLFGVFQRLHKMEDYEGTGIGLANVRRIVSRHGGRTWAEGSLDKGATLYFSIPTLSADPS